MYLSNNWLSDLVAHGLDADALAELLTMSGLEVEEVATSGPSLDGVVVGAVVDVRPHPNADRLRVCDVDLGDGEPVQIVCGAPNVAAGQKVPVATVGTELMLPAKDGSRAPVTIKKGKIRGEVSNGMICAEDELGLGDAHDGILVLNADAEVGQPFERYLAERDALPGDAVLDIAITPNRPDATSHLGVARDVAALTGAELRRPEVDVPPVGGDVEEMVSVTIEVPEDCPRFVGMVVRDVTVGPSPEWMQERLRAVGLRPISNVVDVTNWVMMELGQPLHAYDLDRLGPEVVVRAAAEGETVTTLDGVERTLPAGTVVVATPSQAVGIAGVMGGASTEVTDATTTVFLEGAYWNPAAIRRAAKVLGMQTDASYRFERGADPTAQPLAVARAAALVAETGGGEIVDGRIDENPVPYRPRTVTVRPSRIAHVLGMDVPEADVRRLLTAIGFGVAEARSGGLDAFADAVMREEGVDAALAEAAGGGLEVTVPPFRPDVEREIDVIEEVARLWGYDRLPAPAATPVPLVPAGDTPDARLLDRTRRRLAALGFRELATNSLLPTATAETFADAAWTGMDGPPVETLNPISQEMAALRPSLLPGLLAVASYNQARGAGPLRLFEAGHVMRRSADASDTVEGYHEHTSLAVGMSGETPSTWNAPARPVDVYDLKGVVMDLLADLGIDEVEETPHPAPDALTAYALDLSVGDVRLGRLGRVADAVADAADLTSELFVAELDWDALARLATRDQPPAYRPISRFPTVDRDLALVVPEAQPAAPLLRTIRQAGRPLLQDARVFDVYRGEGVPEGSKSLAIALRFGADKTLRDQEVDGRVRRIVKALEAQHQATLRS
ncbi:phenylalanine--tRNA ligase subunit beta [Rubrivirga sp.]|uniref:phenylalanine--tRNA ligase subunit beta n=1 Tax=Rubrivirga sp. TaxID=1885344 RepID=UPI003B51D961